MKRKLKMGMVGGGIGAFIGGVHRRAATIDGQVELVCGAFSSTPEKSKASGEELYLPPERVYADYKEMILKEKELPEGERMDFVSVVTPNHMHFAPAKMALENGFPVVCDKPLAFTIEEAQELRELVHKTGLPFCITYNYTGYPMVKQAKAMIKEGKLGKIRKVVVEYPQGWLSDRLEDTEQKQASWRTDPSKAGIANCMGDIGTHAANLAEYISGLEITEMCADLTSFVGGRTLEDDGNVLLHFNNGAKGILHASQISVGEENNLNIRIYGETGGLTWHQIEPNTLIYKTPDTTQLLRTAVGPISGSASLHTRTPAGHPEGYIEAFANVYLNFIYTLKARLAGEEPAEEYLDFPDVDEGVRGMAFIKTVVEANTSEKKWYPYVKY